MPRRIAATWMTLIAVVAMVLAFTASPAVAAPDAGHSAGQDAAHAGNHAGDHAGDHGDHGDHGPATPIPPVKQGVAPAITALVVFGIVMFILATKVWPVITGGLDERNAKIREEIAAAEAAQKQARAALEEYEKSLAEARVEAQRMLDETRTQQAALAGELKAKAERELNEMREKAKREIETAKKTAIGELYAESVNIATQMAGKILQREVTVADQQRMLEEALGEMSKN